jgi:hypothetical protein
MTKIFTIDGNELNSLVDVWGDLMGLRSQIDAMKNPAAIMCLNNALMRLNELLEQSKFQDAFVQGAVASSETSVQEWMEAKGLACTESTSSKNLADKVSDGFIAAYLKNHPEE